MRLHHFIEQLNNYKNIVNKSSKSRSEEAIHIIERTNEMLEIIKNEVTNYVQIDTGKLYADLPEQQIVELQQYSIDMIKNGLNILPYDNIVFSFFYQNESVFIVNRGKDKIYTLFTIKSELDIPQIFSNVFCFKEEDGWFETESGFWFNLDGSKIKDETLKNVGSCCLQFLLATCAIMNSHDVEIITTPAPKRLNEKRVKKGKPPIGDIKEIRINYGGKRYMIDGREEGGTHASPRLHWRRGHVRRLASGKITNVRPTLVGAIKGEEPKMPVYKITNTKERQFDDEAESSKERKQTDCRVYNSNGAECGQRVAHQRALETEVGD